MFIGNVLATQTEAVEIYSEQGPTLAGCTPDVTNQSLDDGIFHSCQTVGFTPLLSNSIQ